MFVDKKLKWQIQIKLTNSRSTKELNTSSTFNQQLITRMSASMQEFFAYVTLSKTIILVELKTTN